MENQTEIKLQELVSGDNVETLASEILAARGGPLSIDAASVSRIDTPCIEVLMSAKKLWAEEEEPLSYSETSEDFETALTTLGLEKTMMETGDSIDDCNSIDS